MATDLLNSSLGPALLALGATIKWLADERRNRRSEAVRKIKSESRDADIQELRSDIRGLRERFSGVDAKLLSLEHFQQKEDLVAEVIERLAKDSRLPHRGRHT